MARTVATGTDTASGALTVDGIIPTIEGSKELHQNVPEGEDIRVLCKYEGDPKPEQTWYKVITSLHFLGKSYLIKILAALICSRIIQLTITFF